jgi:hypothetical protein
MHQGVPPTVYTNIEISWENIVYAYEIQFEAVYGGEPTKKLYLSDSIKVDGASEIWMELSLLDAIISIHKPSTPRISPRRLFDQRSVLLKAVVDEVSAKYHNPDTTDAVDNTVTDAYVRIDTNDWKDFDRLRSHIVSSVNDRGYRVSQKFDSQINRIFTALAARGSLQDIIRELVGGIIFR